MPTWLELPQEKVLFQGTSGVYHILNGTSFWFRLGILLSWLGYWGGGGGGGGSSVAFQA